MPASFEVWKCVHNFAQDQCCASLDRSFWFLQEKIDILSLSTAARLNLTRRLFSDWRDDPSSEFDIFVRRLSAPSVLLPPLFPSFHLCHSVPSSYLTEELVEMLFSPEDKAYIGILKDGVQASRGLDLYVTNGEVCPLTWLDPPHHDITKVSSPQRFAVNDAGLLCLLSLDGLALGEQSATLLHQDMSPSKRGSESCPEASLNHLS